MSEKDPSPFTLWLKSCSSVHVGMGLRTDYSGGLTGSVYQGIVNNNYIIVMFYYRSTPIETLHTILLGLYKYLLRVTIPKFSGVQKEKILARIGAFNFSGFRVKLVGNVVQYHQSFIGCDWAQMAPFVIFPYLNEDGKCLWLALSKVGV